MGGHPVGGRDVVGRWGDNHGSTVQGRRPAIGVLVKSGMAQVLFPFEYAWNFGEFFETEFDKNEGL